MTQSTDQFRLETLVVIDAVKRAVTIARRGVGAEDITAKGGRDLVTVTDVAVEDSVRGIVAEALGFSVIGEERVARRRPMARRTGSSIPSVGLGTLRRESRCTA